MCNVCNGSPTTWFSWKVQKCNLLQFHRSDWLPMRSNQTCVSPSKHFQQRVARTCSFQRFLESYTCSANGLNCCRIFLRTSISSNLPRNCWYDHVSSLFGMTALVRMMFSGENRWLADGGTRACSALILTHRILRPCVRWWATEVMFTFASPNRRQIGFSFIARDYMTRAFPAIFSYLNFHSATMLFSQTRISCHGFPRNCIVRCTTIATPGHEQDDFFSVGGPFTVAWFCFLAKSHVPLPGVVETRQWQQYLSRIRSHSFAMYREPNGAPFFFTFLWHSFLLQNCVWTGSKTRNTRHDMQA